MAKKLKAISKQLTTKDLLMGDAVNLILKGTGIEFIVDDNSKFILYEDISLAEALLIRLQFNQQINVVSKSTKMLLLELQAHKERETEAVQNIVKEEK